MVSRLIEKYSNNPRSVLDVGCGDCFVLNAVATQLPGSVVVGIEPELEGLRSAPVHRVLKSIDDLGDDRFDLLLLLDVLEHVEDDEGFLNKVAARLTPGGVIVATVPADAQLFSDHDRFLLHFRRYERRAFERLATSARLSVLSSGAFFHSLYLVRRLQMRHGLVSTKGVGAWAHGAVVSRAVEFVLSLDSRLPSWMPGLSLYGVWRR